jgi:CarD family transcriptional regulator
VAVDRALSWADKLSALESWGFDYGWRFLRVAFFKIGDNAVYPSHGVGVVRGIQEKDIGGKKKYFYVLQLLENGSTILIPTDKVKDVGLRAIIAQKDVSKIYKILKTKEVAVDNQTWNRRYREYMEKIKTGSVYEIAEVLRDLYRLKLEKDLSFGERKMLDTAKSLLVKELSLAQSIREDVVESELRDIFGIVN